MCIAPVRIPDVSEPVACRVCWQCVSARQYDWVGRCIAEANVSDHVRFLTLTYAGDVPGSVVFLKDHLAKMMYRLRSDGRRKGADGWKVRYIITGELGHAKGRVHWHAILFFKGECPPMELTSMGRGHMFQWHYWPHGATVAKIADAKDFRYCVKYLFKDVDKKDPAYIVPAPSMSKFPPIGDTFVSEYAADLVERGLPLNTPEYQFSEVKERKSGRHRTFWLQGKSKENLMARYTELWRLKYGTEPPASEYLMKHHFDKIARAEMAEDPERLVRDIDAKRPKFRADKFSNEDFAEAGSDPFGADRKALALLHVRHGDVPGLLEVFSDDTAELHLEGSPYHLARSDLSGIVRQLEAAGLRPRNVRKLARWLAPHWRVTLPKGAFS